MLTNYLPYEVFKRILTKTIFQNAKISLLEKVAKYPSRYTGLFRPTKPKLKLIQNITQSNEILFGDAFEIIINEYLNRLGFSPIKKNYSYNGNDLMFDQIVGKENTIIYIEQKIRDDHDSTKKRGQIENFEKKGELLLKLYPDFKITGIMYFIDPNLKKNRRYYMQELQRISTQFNFETHLFYGKEFFEWIGKDEIWLEITSYLSKWKEEIPDFPTINFDENPEESFEEIKHLQPNLLIKLLRNDAICKEIFPELFPEKTTLNLLLEYYIHEREKNKTNTMVIEHLKKVL
ncbi:MAG: restriction endonuclease [Candidatus Heimdallarchaeum aukensis]|uniref:type II site-specific deoxyribonuclease n=1 Tax=Candidatus Heimdallarchaeum aukensis TaxID=2876573 RepID=A0A9Y1FLS7_9ARCH|nr:MAG: restriction endonuclease [Candidatus Heimdallarchaeum aukensis]